MQTPDGKDFGSETGAGEKAGPLAAAVSGLAAAVGFALMGALRLVGKVIITVWRLAGALDSALWRAFKLMMRRSLRWTLYAAGLAGAALRSLLMWLPTRTGRAYSAVSGAVLAVATLWIIDELRAGPGIAAEHNALMRAPEDLDDPILARIGARYVHLSEIEASARAAGVLAPDEALTPRTAFDRELVEAYVEQRLLAGAALREGLQRAPAVSRRINAARDRVLAAAYMDGRLSEAVTPEAVKRLYDAQAGVTNLGDEVEARHIVVATREEADAVIARLEAGERFAALARELSIDRATAPLGGQVGWFTRAMMTPAFSRAAFAVEPGERAEPFETEFGWHVLEVTDRRATRQVPFSAVSDNIEDFLRRRTIETTLKDLEEASQVVYFRAEAAPETTAPAPLLPGLAPGLGARDPEAAGAQARDASRSGDDSGAEAGLADGAAADSDDGAEGGSDGGAAPPGDAL